MKNYYHHFLVISILLYTVSLLLPSFCFGRYCEDSFGLFTLIMGALTFFGGGVYFTWLANPALWFAWIRFKKPIISFYASLLAVLFSWSFLLFSSLPGIGECGSFLEPQSCDSVIREVKSGYYFWLGSAVTLLAVNSYRFIQVKRIRSGAREMKDRSL